MNSFDMIGTESARMVKYVPTVNIMDPFAEECNRLYSKNTIAYKMYCLL